MIFVDVYQNDNGNLVVLPMDSMLRVALAENPSTGYHWQVDDMADSCLELVSREFFASGDPVIGAPGMVVFCFRPAKPGRCALALKLWRPWEGYKSIVKRFRAVVSISNR
jgi:inhibitor of cysteine peptidase